MKNNNSAVIKKITRASLKADKKRNFFIAAAILITTFMIAVVFSFGLSSLETIQKQRLVSIGSAVHGFITAPTEKQAEKINELDYMEAGEKVRSLGTVVDSSGQLRLVIMSMNSGGWESMYAPVKDDIVGTYPQKENEVMCPTWYLEELGIKEPKVGMEVTIKSKLDMTDVYPEVQEKKFILSGFFTGYGNIGAYATDTLFTADSFADANGLAFEECGAIMFKFKDYSRIGEDYDRLVEDIGKTENQQIKLNVIFNNEAQQNATYMMVIGASIFFMFTGYLLIYNVMNISVSRDIRFYGMLKTIGTTPKQLKRIVRSQVLLLCIIGIPVGLLLAAAFSFLVLPAFLRAMGREASIQISFSPVIYIGAVLLSVVTAFIGGTRPAKAASKVSPIEAMRFSGVNAVKGRAHNPAKVKPWRMALRNIFREKKRTVLVFLSLFMSVAAFMITSTITSTMNVDDWIDSYMSADFTLGNSTGSIYNQSEPKDVLNKEFLDEITRLEGFESMEVTSYGSSAFENTGEMLECVKEAAKNSELLKDEDGIDEYISRTVMDTMVAGADAEALKKLFEEEGRGGEFDAEAFDKGEFVLLKAEDAESYEKLKSITLINGEKKQALNIGGSVPKGFYTSVSGVFSTIVCSNKVVKQYAPDALAYSVDINVKPGFDEEMLEQLKELKTDESYMNSKLEERERMEGTKIIIFALGGGISLILGLIGIMNFINVMSVGIITRKHELAVLESVGMQRKQAKAMLVFEGLWYALITIGLALTLGSLASYGVFLLLEAQADFLVFTYPVIPVAVAGVVIVFICALAPARVYKAMSRIPVVDRLRLDY